MPKDSYAVDVRAPCEEVFQIVHDYERRLLWDSMLSEARLLGDAKEAALGVRSLCVGTWRGVFQPIETEYTRFVPGQIAAVKLTNRPLFFQHFAATIKHEPLGPKWSRVTYIYSFRARPALLASLLEPMMRARLRLEVRERLHCLQRYIERSKG